MPIYEYRCNACRKRFEQIVYLRAELESDALVCPHCGSTEAARLPSRFAMAGLTRKSEEDAGDFDADLDSQMDDMGTGDLGDDLDSDDAGDWDE
jgi:putative FmdB family regulatory protein